MAHFYDDETGLPSWELFEDRLEHALVRASRSSQALAVALMRAECINDAGVVTPDPAGWRAGIAQRLRLIVRTGDTVAAAPDDLFALLMEDVSSSLGASVGVERTLADIADLELDGTILRVEFHAGVSVSGPPHRRATELLLESEVALLRSMKRPGTDFALYDAAVDRATLEELETQFERSWGLARTA